MGAQQRGPGGPQPTQNFGWAGHNAFGSTNIWAVCSSILRKISRIGATKRQILRLKCTNSLSVGAPPQTPLGSADPRQYLWGLLPRGQRERGKEKRGEKGKVKGKEGRRGERRDLAHPKILAWRSLCLEWTKRTLAEKIVLWSPLEKIE